MTSTSTKTELARMMEVSASKLRKLLNEDWYDELEKVGYNRNLKILSPKMLEIINENWGLEQSKSYLNYQKQQN